MENLFRKSSQKINNCPRRFYRYLYNKINYNNRLISVLGARGTGKTTLLLQIGFKFSNQTTLYVALDDLFFSSSSLYGLAEEFNKRGGELLLLDEVHKYPNWSRELKLIYDDFPNLKTLFTSSSILDIYKGESDLSRRALSYHLKELSFREFLLFHKSISLPTFRLNDILNNHESITNDLLQKFKPLQFFHEYLQVGAYPYYDGEKEEYYQKLRQTISLIFDVDMAATQNINYANIAKLKRLLYILAVNVPFTPNISKLSERIGINRNYLVEAIHFMEKAELISALNKQSKSIRTLSKPDKIWMQNTNLSYAISNSEPDIGNLRETFFISQMQHIHEIKLSEKADFLVDDTIVFEVGGKSKDKKQINGLENAFVVKDNIETGVFNVIPLWIFGLLY